MCWFKVFVCAVFWICKMNVQMFTQSRQVHHSIHYYSSLISDLIKQNKTKHTKTNKQTTTRIQFPSGEILYFRKFSYHTTSRIKHVQYFLRRKCNADLFRSELYQERLLSRNLFGVKRLERKPCIEIRQSDHQCYEKWCRNALFNICTFL